MNNDDDRTCKSIPEVAQRAGISISQVYDEIAEGRLKARKLGKRTVIMTEDEAEWLAAMPPAVMRRRTSASRRVA